MPIPTAPQLTLLRTTTHACDLLLVVDVPPWIWRARVNGAVAAAVEAVAVDGVTQVRAPFADCMVYFSAVGFGQNDIGESRFKSYSAPTLTVPPLPFALPDDAYITVYEVIPPVSKIPSQQANSLTSEDSDTQYVNQNTQLHPLCNFGPPAVAIADPITGNATVYFYDSSLGVATGATIVSGSYVFPGGTPGSSASLGTSGVPIAVSFPIGRHYVSHTVVDSNGQTMTGYRVVWVLDPANLPLATSYLELGDLSQDVELGGFTTQIVVHNVADDAAFPDGAQVILRSLEKWRNADGSTNYTGSIGGSYRYRENIKFVGYIRQGTLSRNWKDKTVEFQCDGIGMVIDGLAGVASNHTTTSGVPDNWHEFTDMIPDFIGFHLLTEHATIAEICDIKLTSLDYQLKYCDLQEGSLRAQLVSVFQSVRSRFGSNLQGMLYAEPNPQLLPLASRPVDKIMDVVLGDLRDDVELGVERYGKPTSQVQFFGFAYADDGSGNFIEKPWNSLAPAVRYATGKNERIDGVRADSQSEANDLSGLYEGWMNNDFDEIVLHMRGNFSGFLDAFPSQYLTLTVPAASNARELDFNLTKLWIKRVTHSYKASILMTDVVCEKDSFGAPGITGPYPIEPPAPPGPPPPGPPPVPPPPPPVPPPPWGGGSWLPEIYLLTGQGVYWTTNFTGPGGAMPTWTKLAAGLPASVIYRAIQPDPFRSGTRQYLLIRDNVGGVDALYVRTGGAWSKLVDESNLNGLMFSQWGAGMNVFHGITAFQTDINQDGYIGLWWQGTRQMGFFPYEIMPFFWSTDYGATWNIMMGSIPIWQAGDVVTSWGGQIGDYAGGSGHAAGDVMYVPVARYASSSNMLWRSDDKGDNWANVSSGVFNMTYDAFNTDVYQDVLYALGFNFSTHTQHFRRGTSNGTAWSADLLPLGIAISGTQSPYRFHTMFNGTGSYASIIRISDDNLDIRKTIDAGASWTTYPHDAAANGMMVHLGMSVLYDSDGKIYGMSLDSTTDAHRAIWASDDEGQTWEEKAGTNAGTSPYTDSIPGSAPAIAICQVFN